MKSVLFISNSLWNIKNFRLDLINYLIDKNYKITILCEKNEKIANKLKELRYNFIYIKTSSRKIHFFNDIILLIKYYSILAKLKPDYIITYTIKPNIYASIISKLLKIKTINNITGLGSGFLINSFLTRIIIILYRIALSKTHHTFFHNYSDRNYFIKNKIININNSSVVNGSGVNIKKFKFIKNHLNNEIRYLYSGRLMREKGIYELAQAVEYFNLIKSNIKFEICGEIVDSEIKIVINKLNKFDNFKFYGFLEDVRDRISYCNFMIIPSYSEGKSKSMLEGMSVGRPVIASNIPGNNEVIIENKNGFLFEAKNTKSLINQINSSMNLTQKELDILSMNAHKTIVDKFSNEIIFDSYMDMLKNDL